jgi:hypothetical protein
MKLREWVAWWCSKFLYAGGLRPTNMSATVGGGRFALLTSAVGNLPNAADSATPSLLDSFTIHERPYLGGETSPIYVSCTDHPASLNTDSKSSANCAASPSPSLVRFTTEPWNGSSAATIFLWSVALIRRCSRRCCSSKRASSAFAALVCCSAAFVSKPATWLRMRRLLASRVFVRSSASLAFCVASPIRALASAWTASCTLFPELQTKYVPMTVNVNNTTYPPKIQLWWTWAACIFSRPDELFVSIALVVLGLTVVACAGIAIIASNRRTAAIIREYRTPPCPAKLGHYRRFCPSTTLRAE